MKLASHAGARSSQAFCAIVLHSFSCFRLQIATAPWPGTLRLSRVGRRLNPSCGFGSLEEGRRGASVRCHREVACLAIECAQDKSNPYPPYPPRMPPPKPWPAVLRIWASGQFRIGLPSASIRGSCGAGVILENLPAQPNIDWWGVKMGPEARKMRSRAIVAALAIGMSCPVLADDQPPGKSQQVYSPRLGDIMVATQLRHFKLWYAGRVKNWGLANYELVQIRASFEDVRMLSPNIPVPDMTTMTQPADEVGSAIEAKDSAKFASAFGRLTSACNNCHQEAGFGFIVIREPRMSPIQTSPFSDEAFSPR
jgi:hypothetical protein